MRGRISDNSIILYMSQPIFIHEKSFVSSHLFPPVKYFSVVAKSFLLLFYLLNSCSALPEPRFERFSGLFREEVLAWKQ